MKNFINDAEKYFKKLYPTEDNNLIYSNHIAADTIMRKLRDKLSQTMSEALNNVYIGFIAHPSSNIAGAFRKFPDNSYLVTFNTESLYKLNTMSSLLATQILNKYYLKKDDIKSKSLLIELQDMYSRQFYNKGAGYTRTRVLISKYINKNLNEYQQNISEVYSQIFEIALTFILTHEIGHHILNHTDFEQLYVELPKYENFINKHKEFQADSFAVYSVLETFTENDTNSIMQLEALLIPLLIIAIDINENYSSTTHPSILARYRNILDQFERRFENYQINSLLIDFNKLCDYLYKKGYFIDKWWEK